MKPRPVDQCLVVSTELIATTRSKLAQLQFSVDTCATRIEVSTGAIAASQALLAKLNGVTLRLANGVEVEFDEPGSEQTSDGRL